MNEVLKGPRMLSINVLAQITFFKCVNYFEKRREEIRVVLERRDKYIGYVLFNLTVFNSIFLRACFIKCINFQVRTLKKFKMGCTIQ